MTNKVYYQRVDGVPICKGCIHFNPYQKCYLKDTGTSVYQTQCEYYSNIQEKTNDQISGI
jgi:hypothetical protein